MKPDSDQLRSLKFEAIGTAWEIDVYDEVPDDAWANLKPQITDRIEQFDQHYSRFRADSLVTAMAQAAGSYQLPDDAPPLFHFYRQLYDATQGAVTPLIGQTLVEAGYDEHYTLSPGTLTSPPPWDDVLNFDQSTLTLRQPALLDIGAAGKGYLVDLIAKLIDDQGYKSYCVEAGGDMHYRRPCGPALRVGLEHPADPGQVIGVAELTGQGISLCGSAGNRRAWGTFHHIIDPRGLNSPRHVQAVWVTAGSTMVADGLATALMLVEPASLAPSFDFEFARILADGSAEWSRGFPAQFYTK